MRAAEDAVRERCGGHRGRQASEDVTCAWEVASRERRGRRGEGEAGARIWSTLSS
jgi:hypothetical protein